MTNQLHIYGYSDDLLEAVRRPDGIVPGYCVLGVKARITAGTLSSGNLTCSKLAMAA